MSLLSQDQALPLGLDDNTLQRLTTGLSDQQLIWLSGYFYGRTSAGRSEVQNALQAQAAPQPAAPEAPAAKLTILYGSQTGNSKKVAQQTAEKAKQRGVQVTVQDVNDYATRALKTEQQLLLVVSTQGEGEPPVAAEELHQFLLSNRAPKLPDLRYSVLALGDKSYVQFCQTGREFDERLAELGAQRLLERVECDVDYQEAAQTWADRVLNVIAAEANAGGVGSHSGHVIATETLTAPEPAAYSHHNPFEATVLEKIQLNGRGSSKETYHLELSLADSGLHYEPGDALSVVPRNGEELVAEVLQAARLDGAAPIQLSGVDFELGTALTQKLELSVLTRDVLERYAAAAPLHKPLADIVTDIPQLQKYVYGRDVADLLREFPADLSAEQLATVLRPLPARAYSIASSLLVHPDEVHLTVGAVRYAAHGRTKHGVCSSHLADRLEIDHTARVFVERNEYFKLPQDAATDIIMVGAGTGVAPFRAFVEERVELGAEGRNWLFFGNPNFTTDFLYQTEWLQHLKRGTLRHLDVAFSRDQAEKIYVQHRLLEKSRDVYGWLENGAHFYVCGDKARLGSAIQEALRQVVQREAGCSAEDAADYLRALKKQRRYLEDVY
ncbi:assimilatory sulfite reductase (NADPH) flavoprotein subunit [Hymenobacter chitinivorans]|uniref:assimilatory sulfite reductase (NADPH) n=1 Tax=Hymenobacter chitinivorans DSM 11115 TaxID=1121954 RepID=A0A2M9BLN0_9BACT|nr:assimilatory sulfite reductase (NADPH) flavoprotein subunit [Hymenobacter chitinivorans]PJJ58842.1 sulfite reductase (NADPH) flavoprotein alpha-component [Hymenobacter chitinivorans DSM 11115]